MSCEPTWRRPYQRTGRDRLDRQLYALVRWHPIPAVADQWTTSHCPPTTEKEEYLKANGADLVIIDNGNIKEQVRNLFPNGVDKVLELIGTRTLKDSLKCIKPKGIVCMTGILGSEWTMKEFTPMGDIPSLGRLTVYMGEAEDLQKESLQEFIDAVESGDIRVTIDRTFKLDEIVEAHKHMESNQAKGKIVVEI